MATEKTIVFLARNFEDFRTYRIDADTTWHIDRSAEHKSIERAIGGRSAGTTCNRVTIQHTAGEREGATIVNKVESLRAPG